MADQIGIYNMALANIGQSETVASLSERSKAQITCSQFWENARDATLADFPWPFATKFQLLAPIASPPRNWAYQYQYPVDCLRAMYLTVEGMRRPSEEYQPVFEVAYGDGGRIILTDQPLAELAYVARINEVGRFDPLFVTALAWRLAYMIAMPMTATRTMVETAGAMYKDAVQTAWAHALNESKQDYIVESEFIRARY